MVYSAVDGDQHGLLIGLVDWARTLGLRVIAGGKAGDRDHIFDPARRTLTRSGGRSHVDLDSELAAAFAPIGADDAGIKVAARRRALQGYSSIGVCGMSARWRSPPTAPACCRDVPELHAPITRIAEIPEVAVPAARKGAS